MSHTTAAFYADPFASALKGGEGVGCSGLVLVVAWGWGSQDGGYQRLASEMACLDSDATHVYDGAFTHCTVATLSSFKNCRSVFFHASPADQDRIIQAWHESLVDALAQQAGDLHPFELVFRSLETSPAATFLQADDRSKTLTALRSAVKKASENPLLGDLSVELEDKYRGAHPDLCSLMDALHVPDIVHSTVMRLASQPSDGGQRLAQGLAELGRRWDPVAVKVEEMTLVHEQLPYMHLRREGAVARRFNLVLPR